MISDWKKTSNSKCFEWLLYGKQLHDSWWNFYSELFQTFRRVWWSLKGSRNWFYWQNGTILDDILIPNVDADLSIDIQENNWHILIYMSLLPFFYDEQNELCKVFRFNLLDQMWLDFWLIIWINEWTNKWMNIWMGILWVLYINWLDNNAWNVWNLVKVLHIN